MSEILKAKQRLLQKSITIMEAPEQEGQFKIFTRTGNAASIPKLNARQKIERSISEIQIEDNDLNFQNQIKRFSPKFAKTERNGLLRPNMMNYQRYEMMSQKAESINLFGRKKSSHRRITQYSQYGMESIGGADMSFTDNQQSVYNQSPIKTVKNTVHGEKLNIIITKIPTRKALSPVKPKQCQIDYVSEFVKQQKSKNQLFTDHMFPPKFTIIFNKKYMYLQEGLKLQRLSKIYEGNQQLRIIKFCQPTLMTPGKFTSPALYSALIILSQDPTRVLNLFGNQQYNSNGIYYVQICKDGVWRYMIVDDYLPVRILAKRSLLFLNTLPKNGFIQIWPCILQKAIAKMYGTYQDIYLTADRGVKDIVRTLTGLPCSEYTISKDFRTFLIIIDTAVKKKQIVVLETVPEQFRETAHVKGIEWEQSYQIIEVKKTNIVLRNVIDKDLVTKLSFQQAMLFKKLLIFRNENNYAYLSRTLRHKKKCYSIVKVEIKSNLKCYWDVWENSEVYYKNHIGSHIQYSKSKYMIQIKKEQHQDQTYDSASHDEVITESGKQISMNPGVYQISVHLCQRKQLDFTLSYYGEQEIEIVRMKNMEKWPIQCQCQ